MKNFPFLFIIIFLLIAELNRNAKQENNIRFA